MTNQYFDNNNVWEAICSNSNIISELQDSIKARIRVEFCSNEEVEGPCWTWTGFKYQGYGRLRVRGIKSEKAHRVIYQLLHGSISDKLVCDHLCKNRSCVNPNHIEIVTQSENLKRSPCASTVNASRAFCVAGHKFTISNTYISRGKRFCRACNTRRNAAYHLRKRVANRSNINA